MKYGMIACKMLIAAGIAVGLLYLLRPG